MDRNLTDELRVSEIGEQGLLGIVQRFCPPELVGDDAALLVPEMGKALALTTDVLVDGVHFSLGLAVPGQITTSPADAGWRAVAANLSDLAAMGATPLGITVGLSLPADCPVAWVEQLYQGMVDCLGAAPILGGDICRSTVLSIAITAIGQVPPQQAIRRSHAKPGDGIVVTGWHGLSKAGLELLLKPEIGNSLKEDDRQRLIQAHQRPKPRLDLLPILQALQTDPDTPFPIAGMDSSDGLADAVVQLCRASGVGARLDRSQIPVPPPFFSWLSPAQTMEWILYGGEDFELVLCLPPIAAQQLIPNLGEGASMIGEICEHPEVLLVDPTGQYPPESLSLDQGFQHFSLEDP